MINPIYIFKLNTTAPSNTMEGAPGDSVSFTLQVQNTGTGTDTYKFRASSADETVFSVGTINDINNLGVDSYGSTAVTITITHENEHAHKGTYPIEITAESDKDASVTHSIILKVNITASAEVEITPASQADSAEPGDVIDYKVKVTNKGNAIDTFDLTLSGSYKHWGEILDINGTQITQATLNAITLPGSFTDIIVRVTIPSVGETTAGQSYPITITAASTTTEGIQDTSQVTTTVDEYIELALVYSDIGKKWINYDPNKSLPIFWFKVTNNGNIDETSITVDVDDMPTSWNTPTIDFIDILEPGKNTTFSIIFNIPPDEDEGEYTIQISVTSSDGSEDSDRLPITINITKPDLKLTRSDVTGLDDIAYLKDRVGNTVNVRVRIHNVGHSKAEDVEVILYEDGTVRGTRTISSIAPGSYENVDFKWVVVVEEVEIWIEITPVKEINQGNNFAPPIFLDLRPELSFDGEQLNFSKTNPAPNEEITVTAFVKNEGGNVKDVIVRFYYDTKVIGMKKIDIDYDETVEASITWKVPNKPEKVLEVKAEIEKSGAKGWDDDIARFIEVGESKDRGLFDYLWIILIIIVGLTAFFAGYFLKGRGKGEHSELEEDKKGIGEKESPSGNVTESKMMPPPPPPPPPPQPTIDKWLNEGVEPSGKTEP
jgi:uncharacterized membrane protein